LNLGVSRNRFCDFLADPDSRSFSRFYTNIHRSRYEDIFTFEIQRSDGLLYSLDTPAGAGSGADVPVTLANRHDFVAAAVKVRRRFLAFGARLWWR
jgi:hypothetical protein